MDSEEVFWKTTPPKTNMTPKNSPLEKEIPNMERSILRGPS